MAEPNGATPSKEATPPSATEAKKPDAQQPSGEMVQISKEKLAQLERDAARAATSQSELDVAKRKLERYEKGGKKTAPQAEAFDEKEQLALFRKVNERVMSDEKIRKAMESNPLLRRILNSDNPLQLLDENEFLDVDDAVERLIDHLDENIASYLPATQPGGETATPASPEAKEKPPAPAPAGAAAADAPPVKTAEEKKQEADATKPAMTRVKDSIMSKANAAYGKKGA